MLLLSASAGAIHALVVGERITSAAALDAGVSYVLVNKATGGVIDSAGRGVTNLANLIPAVHDGSTFQMWQVVEQSKVVMAYTAHDTSGGPTAFDTVAFHLSKAGSSPTYNFVINRGHVRRESLVDTDTFDGRMVASGLPTALRGRAAMPFNDGMPNLLKYALGLDPLAPATSGPVQMISESGQEPYLSLAFTRRTVPGDVTLTVQTASHLTFSADLGSVEVSVTPNGNGSEDVIVRSAASLSAQPTQFMRLFAE